MKSLRYIYWFFCLACAGVILAALLFLLGVFLFYEFYVKQGFWGVMGLVATVVVIVFGSYPFAFWHDRPWKKKDREP